jgi:hypothetical protein
MQKELSKDADIIFMPYNYLLDAQSRKTLVDSVRGAEEEEAGSQGPLGSPVANEALPSLPDPSLFPPLPPPSGQVGGCGGHL